MEIYLLKSLACLATFLLFYKQLLENENMHVFKRFYLLSSVVAAIVIPLIKFTTYVEPSSEVLNSVIYTSESPAEVFTSTNYLPYFLIGVYFLGVLFFSIKFFRNLRNLILKIQKNPKVKLNSITNVLLSEKTQPHTFFSFIFFNKDKYLHNQIPEDVKIHEEAHARQKHSFDVLFIELLQIIFWINPLIFLLKKAIKLNHEFLADSAVINKGISTSKYQQTLLSFSSGHLQSELVNPINYSSIKKRFTVMKTKTSKMTIWARSLLLLPLLAVLLYGFSAREIIEKHAKENLESVLQEVVLELVVDNDGSIFLDDKKVSIADLQKIGKEKYTMASINTSEKAPQPVIDELIEVIRSKGISKISICSPGARDFMNPHPVPNAQEKATPEMIAEYNKLVKHYNSLPQKNMVVRQEDINKIMAILSRMTPEQKSEAEKINFNVPPPAPVPVPQPKEVLPPPPPPAPPVPAVDKPVDLPPPPPPPPSPEEAIKDWMDEDADFFYNGKAISGKEALKIVQENNGKNLNVQIQENNSKKTIRLSDKKE